MTDSATRTRAGGVLRASSDLHAELEALREIGRALSAAHDVQATLQAISRTTANVMHMDSCSIYLLDKSQHSLTLKASTGLARAAVDRARLELGEGITGYAAQHGEPVAVRDAARDPRFKYLPETKEQKFKSLAAVPLISQGTIIGAMNVQTTRYHAYTQPEIELFSLIGELARTRKNRTGKANGAQGRNRTTDTAIFSRMLYQLSYLGTSKASGAWERAVYSQAGRACPPCFACLSGIARRATTDGYAWRGLALPLVLNCCEIASIRLLVHLAAEYAAGAEHSAVSSRHPSIPHRARSSAVSFRP